MISAPSIWALIAGMSLSAWTTALVKKDMKPSFTPFFFTKSSWYLARRAITADISTSLNVVSIAASCWAATRREAIVWRSLLILVRVWRPPVGAGAAAAGAGAAAGAAKGGLLTAASMSPLVTRPALPEPATAAGSMPVAAARRRTAGDLASLFASAAGAAAATVAGAEAAAEAAPAVAVSSMVATTWPIFTSVPAA